VDLIAKNTSYFQILNRNFTQYITEDGNNPANLALRRVLLQRSQKNPELIFNQMLSWLFVQQEDYAKAFAQEKAIYQRQELKSLNRIIDLALISKDENELTSAEEMLYFSVEKASSQRELLSAERELLLVKQLMMASSDEIEAIEEAYASFIKDW